jgi:adenylate cyclase
MKSSSKVKELIDNIDKPEHPENKYHAEKIPEKDAEKIPEKDAEKVPEKDAEKVPEVICMESKRAEMLLTISKTMATFESLDGMLGALVDVIVAELNADRATVFMHDKEAGELYSRIARGNFQHEIRMAADKGVAGHVFNTGQSAVVNKAYADPHFDKTIDEKTGYVTKNILCAPIKTVKGEVIGVAQVLNKRNGDFTAEDLGLLDAMTAQAAVALKTSQIVEQMNKARKREKELLDIVADITSEIDLGKILAKVMTEATRMLDSDRSTLFLNDEKKNELFSKIAAGTQKEIRLPNHLGIAGAVFTSGETVNIPYAYADLRFNPSFDRSSGYFTKSILCVPVTNKNGKTIGVIQLLNKRRGHFTEEDESRLKTFTAQISIALENAKLFDDVQNMKNRNESMLESMSNAVITINEDGKIVTCNAAGYRILKCTPDKIVDKRAEEFFSGSNAWVLEKLKRVEETQAKEEIMGAEIEVVVYEAEKPESKEEKTEAKPKSKIEKISVNMGVLPLVSVEKKKMGSMLMIEDISNEKRMKSTMSRYMDAGIAEQLLAGGEDVLGGRSTVATVLFSDIRSFSTLTEELGAQGTVSLLNEYFTIMVDCIQHEGGMLDKFIGDAIMAGFGIPIPHEDDEDRALRASIKMITELFRWNKGRVAEGKKPVDMGIGLNTDTVVSGNIGSQKRMDYTMIGDGVNLASRLESACKQYFSRILISEFTFRKLKGSYLTREVDKVVVKGKTESVQIFEVLDYHTAETFPNLIQVIRLFNEGVSLYREMKWDNAIKAFTEIVSLNPNDRLTRMYIERCEYMKEHPPGDDWDGVWVMKTK